MTRRLRRFVVFTVVALALFGVFASSALAFLEDLPSPNLGSSPTNPSTGVDSWWREGWGNSLYPKFIINKPGMPPEDYVLGILYTVDRAPGTVIDTSTPDNYYMGVFNNASTSGSTGTNTDQTLDMLGIYTNPPGGSWPPPDPNANNPLEGQWMFHLLFFDQFRYQNGQYDVPFGIDLTPPRAVSGLELRSGIGGSVLPSSAWVPTTRGYIKWTPGVYDDLAGVGYYQVLVDDAPSVPETSTAPNQGRNYAIPGLPTPTSITIESLPPGRHKLSVVAVDRATNVGPEASTFYESDPDTPTIAWTAPTGNKLVPQSKLISVNASDLAGDPTVVFAVDGSPIATVTAPPYFVNPDFSALTTVTPLVLSATVTDKLGRQVTITKAVTWDPSGLVGLTGDPALDVSAGPLGSSTTNPDFPFAVGDILSDRQGWGNSLSPQFTLNFPGPAEGFLYNVVTTTSTIDISHPQNYYRAAKPAGTHLANTLDLQGIFNYPPPSGWRASPVPGSTNPIEGIWYFQFVFYDRNGNVSTHTYQGPFGIDITPPSPVTGLHAVPTLETTGSGSISSGSRAHIAWDAGSYDSLSGVSYYNVLVDGQTVIPADGIVWDIPGVIPNAATIENLTPGRHKISVEAVDRATNVSLLANTTFYSDPDTPTISITKPSGSLIGVNPVISATAADQGGVQSVQFKLDGVSLGIDLSAPYSMNPSLAAFANGPHVLTAIVTDMFGRTVTATKNVTLDKTVPVLTNLRASLSGRNVTLSVRVSKASQIKFTYNPTTSSTGTRVVNKTASAPGTYSLKFTVARQPTSSRAFRNGLSVPYSAQAVDAAGNLSARLTGRVTVRFFRLVRSGGGVRVVIF